jgi:enolase
VFVQVELENGIVGSASVPSGASTGSHEAIERRDGDKGRYLGKGVLEVVSSVNTEIDAALRGVELQDQAWVDDLLIALDGTDNKSRLGANALLGTSLAVARACAQSYGMELFRYIGGCGPVMMPCPMFNVVNGGAHADNSLDFQEFMIRPRGAASFSEGLRWVSEVYHTLKSILKKKGMSVSIGDEGGFAPNLQSDVEALDLLVDAITQAGYRPGADISIAMDCAASELYDEKERRYIEKKRQKRKEKFASRTTAEQISYLAQLVSQYPIDSIEDGLAENDWEGWRELNKELGSRIQIVGDDIFVTNQRFLERGIAEKSANAILIKLNQIGTLTETIKTIQTARRAGWRTVVSHRSGETEDSFIADLCVGLSCGQLKSGAPCRSERTAKYNRLLIIEDMAKTRALYLDTNTRE